MEHEDSSDELVTSAKPYPKCRASLAKVKLASGEESPGSLNSRFAWETQVPVRVRTVPQKRKQLCEARFAAMSSENSEDLRIAT